MNSSDTEDAHEISSREEEAESGPTSRSGGGAKRAKKTIEERYQKKSQLEHILLRPDSYIGSTEISSQQLWVMPEGEPRMQQRVISFAPGLYKIVDEILVNAADVKARETEGGAAPRAKMTAIKVNVNQAEGTIRVWNDGDGIPVAIHKEHKVYVAELIFGQLLTSDNYDDTEARVTGGRNGFGAKLTNIFSTYFEVECADSKRNKKIKVVWTDNMSKQDPPVISPFNGTGDYVAVKFKPDLRRFGITTLDDDLISLLRKRCYDLAGTAGTAVYWNGMRLPVRNFVEYVDLYLGESPSRKRGSKSKGGGRKKRKKKGSDGESSDSTGEGTENDTETAQDGDKENERPPERQTIKIHEKMHRWEVVISQTDGSAFSQVSFVNSICTPKGGHHVNHVIEPLLAALVKKANAKNKGGMEIKAAHVRQHLWVFVKCLIENPAFDSQTKETLTTTVSRFGSKCNLSERTINAVAKSPILEGVLLWAQTKAQVELRRQMSVGKTKGRERLTGISKLEDANEAGGRYAQECTLILTEGDSAKTSCLAGLSVVGRDKYGVFPLRGKLLNVREASFKQLKENREIQNILRILGLQINDKLQDARGLRYGSLMIMTDQDYDGSHIKGLLINMLHHYWPQLLQCNHFLTEFVTPIVKVSKGSVEKAFFTLVEYDMWRKQAGNLTGTGDGELIDMAFSKKRAEDRKRWLQGYREGTFVDHSVRELTFSDFVNKELVQFSRYDNERSIPQLVDGWKVGQRKVLFAVFKKNTKAELKVAQLSGYVAEQSAYHHGEQSLQQTIITMAQRFVGSNNLNFLEPVGQFGSRKEGGKDASAPRYIFTKLAPYTRLVFPEADDPLLEYLYEEGQKIEPKYYVPVIPTVLVNGSEGIGTGWSSFIPNYNPKDIISNLKRFIAGEEMVRMKPWYRGFKGIIEENATKTAFETIGIIEKKGEDIIEISELPIKRWTQDYKEWIEEQLPAPDKKDPWIFDYRDSSSHEDIKFVVKLSAERLEGADHEGLVKMFRLKSSLSTQNYHLFNAEGKVQKYADELEIMKAFAAIRLAFYEGYDPMRELEKKCACLIESILKRETPQEHGLSEKESADEEVPTACGCIGSDFDYLVGMPLWSLTTEKVEDLKRQLRDKEVELENLRQTDIRTLWLKDLDALLEAIEKQEVADQKQREADLAFHKHLENKKGLKGLTAFKGKPKAVKGGAPKAAPKVGSAKSTSKARKKAKPSSDECVGSSDDSDESSDEVSLPDDSSEEDRPSRKQARPQQAPTTNEVKPQVSSRPTAALPTASDGHGFASFLQSHETAKATTGKEENTPQAPAVRPPLQSLSLLDRLRLGGGNSFSSAAPIRTKQLTLDEIFAPTGSSAAKPSNSPKAAQLVPTSAAHTINGPSAPTPDAAALPESADPTTDHSVTKTPPKPKRRRVLADSDDSDSCVKSGRKAKSSTPMKSAQSTPQKPKPRETPKKRQFRNDDAICPATDDDLGVEVSPIASNRPRRAAAQAPKKYTVDSSDLSGDSDASEEASEAESVSDSDE
ncbi:DNA topoisomerase II, putative [Eimeria tenella]|uniref:DNA topoisomerase 2 n=1 Tax=Eimeria tenella TaxID=5802 RepID=U6L230_EIMTE|nr:DNA topoisomerase II, putative [Eimeria tenella]CDJ41830.1 DNA topoisomerase II, putative [Eimeria tenella]|eukprot:XP_013232580.1 DNA topoisomerase II, putative [Eimeria tenella]